MASIRKRKKEVRKFLRVLHKEVVAKTIDITLNGCVDILYETEKEKKRLIRLLTPKTPKAWR